MKSQSAFKKSQSAYVLRWIKVSLTYLARNGREYSSHFRIQTELWALILIELWALIQMELWDLILMELWALILMELWALILTELWAQCAQFHQNKSSQFWLNESSHFRQNQSSQFRQYQSSQFHLNHISQNVYHCSSWLNDVTTLIEQSIISSPLYIAAIHGTQHWMV